MLDKKETYENLRGNCNECFGFCCVALYFSTCDGFPTDKESGKPCINLQADFKCKIHKNLTKKGLKGCTSYDCFGAGQKVAQVTYKGEDWQSDSEKAERMFDSFLIMRQIHEMLFYLYESYFSQTNTALHKQIEEMINETEKLTLLDSDSLRKIDLETHRKKVNKLLFQTSELVRGKIKHGKKNPLKHKKTIGDRLNFIGADLRKNDLRGENLSGGLFIAANLNGVDLTGCDLIGADLRDADIGGADFRNSIFITQFQINSAKGDASTKLPEGLIVPDHWLK